MSKLMKELIALNSTIPAFANNTEIPQIVHEHSVQDSDMHKKSDMIVMWNKCKNSPEELKKLEDTISTSAEYSYSYAANVLHARFPKGENAIASDEWYSYYYNRDILNRCKSPQNDKVYNDLY